MRTTMSTQKTVVGALIKLVFFLLLFPALITYLHLRYTLQDQQLIVVSPAVNNPQQQLHIEHQEQLPFPRSVYGVYRQTILVEGAFERIIPIDTYSIWPIAVVATILAKASSSEQSSDWIQFQDPQSRCFVLINEKWCTPNNNNSNESHQGDLTRYTYEYQRHGVPDNRIRPPLQVAPILPSRSWHGSTSKPSWFPNMRITMGFGPSDFRLNPNRQSQQQDRRPPHPIGDLFLRRPATTLLIGLNVVLAFLYWNRQISPHSVAENYHSIVQNHEWWRCWTGALAHFDLWHIGFNMMTLHALGSELEQRYGSIPFLFYNISLMPITTAIFVGIGYLQQQYQQQHQHHAVAVSGNPTLLSVLSLLSTAGDTVGYSGVLFAWLVIASLEQEATCPISFVPQMCFRTHNLRGFKFSWAPWVSLVVTQMILPKRVSLVGHLSGILAGFLLHWNAFPLDSFQPCILVPYALVVGQWCYTRRLIPIPHTVSVAEDNRQMQTTSRQERDAEACDTDEDMLRISPAVSLSRRRDRPRRQHEHVYRLLKCFQIVMGVLLVGSIVFAKRPWSSILLSFGAAAVIFHFAVCSCARLASSNQADTEELQRLSTLWRGYVVVGVLTVVTDSMTISGMALLWWNVAGTWHTISIAFLAVRASFILVTLSTACYGLYELDSPDLVNANNGGVFAVTLGYTVLQPANVLGHFLFNATKATGSATLNEPFQGQGIVLGSIRNESREVSPLL